MNNSLSSIRSSLNTNLSAVTQLKEVKIGRTTTFSAFPAPRHYLYGVTDQPLDTANNYRTWRHGIDIIMPYSIEGLSVEDAEEEFQDAVDAVLNKLNTEWDANTDHSIVEIGTVRELTDAPFGPAAIMTIVWQANTAHTF